MRFSHSVSQVKIKFVSQNRLSFCTLTVCLNHKIEVIDIPLLGEDFEKLDVSQIVQKQPQSIFITVPNNSAGTILLDKVLTNVSLSSKNLL